MTSPCSQPEKPADRGQPADVQLATSRLSRVLSRETATAVNALLGNLQALKELRERAPGFVVTDVRVFENSSERAHVVYSGVTRHGDSVLGPGYFAIDQKNTLGMLNAQMTENSHLIKLGSKPPQQPPNAVFLRSEAADIANAIIHNSEQLCLYSDIPGATHVHDVRAAQTGPKEMSYEISGILLSGGDMLSGDFTITIASQVQHRDPEGRHTTYRMSLGYNDIRGLPTN